MFIKFDANLLNEKIKDLSHNHRIAFGAACCERMLPNYKKFVEIEQWGDYDFLRNTLNEVWKYSYMDDNKISRDSIKRLMEKCYEIIPDEEDFESIYTSYAVDAGATFYNTLKYCLEEDLKLLMAVVNSLHATVDLFVQEKHNMNPSDPQLEQKIIQDPFMQKELKKQLDDLESLKNCQVLNKQFITDFRLSSENKSNIEI